MASSYPTLRAYEEELQGLAQGVREGGRGLLEVVTEWIQPNPAEEFAMLCRIAERSRRAVLYSLTQYHEQPDDYRAILALNRQVAARGVPIRPVVAPRAIGVLLGLQASQTPFSGCPTFRGLTGLPLPARVARLRDPAVRAAILAEDSGQGQHLSPAAAALLRPAGRRRPPDAGRARASPAGR